MFYICDHFPIRIKPANCIARKYFGHDFIISSAVGYQRANKNLVGIMNKCQVPQYRLIKANTTISLFIHIT